MTQPARPEPERHEIALIPIITEDEAQEEGTTVVTE